MRKIHIGLGVLALCACLSSCGTTYKFVQICKAEPVANATAAQKTDDGLVYENEDCIVSYNLWGECGNAGFVFYNKTDKVINIDLSRTFFVKNGVAYDYYVTTTITKTTGSSAGSTSSAPYGGAYYASSSAAVGANKSALLSEALLGSSGVVVYGSLTQSNSVSYGRSESVSTTNQTILSIPPKTARVVALYSIQEDLFYDCDLNAYPEKEERLTYSADNSPLTFANYITYAVGDSGNAQSIDNQFYISEIANYAEPYLISFVPILKTCDNVLTPDERHAQKSGLKLFKAYVNVYGNNIFYIKYSTSSQQKLYDTPTDNKNYVWSSYYNAYLKSKGNGSFLSNGYERYE